MMLLSLPDFGGYVNQEPWDVLLRAWLHDPVDKAADIRGHFRRAMRYASVVLAHEVTEAELTGGLPDQLASAYERMPQPDARGDYDRLGVSPVAGKLKVFHPLSAAVREIEMPLAEEAVERVLREMFAREMTPRIRFLTLWRLAPERVAGVCEGYRLQPAETRNPDHTLWQHLDSTAALAWALQGGAGAAALLSFKLGPVQPFIEASRSMRDLLTSSWLVSKITFEAMKPVLEACGPTALVYPALRGVPAMDEWLSDEGVDVERPGKEGIHRPSVPHRFLALVPARLLEELRAQVQQAARQAWMEESEWVRRGLKKRLDEEWAGWDRLWESQVASFWDIRTAGYRMSEARPDELLGSERAGRCAEIGRLGWHGEVKPGHWQNCVEISATLMEAECHVRHIPEYLPSGDVPQKCSLLGTYEQMGPARLRESNAFWKAFSEREDQKEKDKLCAVSLVKRFALKGRVRFPDTGELAERNQKVEKAKYFAVLMLDGDDIGKWLSGEKSPMVGEVLHEKIRRHHEATGNKTVMTDVRRPVTPGLHAAISEGLNRFAVQIAPAIVKECRGEVIYSGGDDVLAMLPADTALGCALKLRAAFSSDEVMGGMASCSAGVVFAHYKEDLRSVLSAARAAEKQAKREGRNRLTIVAMRHSGEHAVAGCGWGYVNWVQEMAEMFVQGTTDRWAYQMRAQLPVLLGLPVEAFGAELRRLMKRTEGRKEMEDLVMESLAEYLAGENRKDAPEAMTEFVKLCQTAAFLARPGGDR